MKDNKKKGMIIIVLAVICALIFVVGKVKEAKEEDSTKTEQTSESTSQETETDSEEEESSSSYAGDIEFDEDDEKEEAEDPDSEGFEVEVSGNISTSDKKYVVSALEDMFSASRYVHCFKLYTTAKRGKEIHAYYFQNVTKDANDSSFYEVCVFGEDPSEASVNQVTKTAAGDSPDTGVSYSEVKSKKIDLSFKQ